MNNVTEDDSISQKPQISISSASQYGLSLETYKKVYKCNVDNLLKKYALGNQLSKENKSIKEYNKDSKNENLPPSESNQSESHQKRHEIDD